MEQNLKITAGTWFEATVTVKKANEDGAEMLVKERYVVNALTFTECEAILNSELIPEAVVAEKFASFREVITSDDEKDEEWFKVKIDLTNIDEKTGKEKHTKMIYLVNASSVSKARSYTDSCLGDTMLDYTISDINKTKIIDIINKQV